MKLHSTLAGASPKPPKGEFKAERVSRRRAVDSEEDKRKAEVRKRDGRCRFPHKHGEDCVRQNYHPQVSHQEHKGAGGDKQMLRTQIKTMVLVCPPIHDRLDNKRDLRWVPMTTGGSNGPICWQEQVRDPKSRIYGQWETIATERAIGMWE